MPYTSQEPRFIRERYILVAPIDNMIKLGAIKTCVAEVCNESIISLVEVVVLANKDVRGPCQLVVLPEMVPSVLIGDGLDRTENYHSNSTT